MRRWPLIALLLGLLGVGTGCLGYHLAGHATAASFLPPTIKVIGIPPFKNSTERPQLDQRISEALINEFVKRAKVDAIPSSRGTDAVLEGTIESFRSSPVTFSPTGRSERVEVTVTARIRLVQASPEKVLWAQNHFIFREQYDLPESATAQSDREILAIEEIADGFARAVVTSILEGF